MKQQKTGMWLALMGLSLGLVACAGRGVVPALAPGSVGVAGADRVDGPAAGRTTAYGYVLDDPSGTPLSGVKVRLESWAHGCVKTSATTARCPGYLPWHAVTNHQGRFTLANVPNGDYLLVIGADTPSDLMRPTVHDHVTLKGGVQRLVAPTLPAVPCVNAAEVTNKYCAALASPGVTPYPRPSVETHGEYRLASIDQTWELPCIQAWNANRTAAHLSPSIVDEWLLEDNRVDVYYQRAVLAGPHHAEFPQPTDALTNNNVESAGGNNCAEMVAFFPADTFTGQSERDPRVQWFGGIWLPGKTKGHIVPRGSAEMPIDPRSYLDPYSGPWL